MPLMPHSLAQIISELEVVLVTYHKKYIKVYAP
jgi:hypothetical protein